MYMMIFSHLSGHSWQRSGTFGTADREGHASHVSYTIVTDICRRLQKQGFALLPVVGALQDSFSKTSGSAIRALLHDRLADV